MRLSKSLERLLLVAGALMLALYVDARIFGHVLSRAEIHMLNDQRTSWQQAGSNLELSSLKPKSAYEMVLTLSISRASHFFAMLHSRFTVVGENGRPCCKVRQLGGESKVALWPEQA